MDIPLKIDLRGKTAVVTGAGGVLCSVFARAMAACGARVALLNRSEAPAEKVAAEIASEGGEARAYQCDVLDKKRLEAVRERVRSDLGLCDILLNGAGGNNPNATTDDEFFDAASIKSPGELKTFFDLDVEGVESVFNLNYLGTLLPTQVFSADMVGRKGACIVNISSMSAFTPLTKVPAYSGAKAAVSNLTQWLAVYFSREGIRCNAIAPGFFISKQNRALLLKEDGTPTARAQKIITNTPMSRFGEPEELIGTLLYLLDERASGFVTGTVIPVDGGFAAYSGV